VIRRLYRHEIIVKASTLRNIFWIFVLAASFPWSAGAAQQLDGLTAPTLRELTSAVVKRIRDAHEGRNTDCFGPNCSDNS
jgi:hypothetical protein